MTSNIERAIPITKYSRNMLGVGFKINERERRRNDGISREWVTAKGCSVCDWKQLLRVGRKQTVLCEKKERDSEKELQGE